SLRLKGSQRRPSPVRNQPLKSVPQTSLLAREAVSGDAPGGTRRRHLRRATRPCRSSSSEIVLSTGKPGADLLRPPARIRATHVEQRCRGPFGHRIGMQPGRPAALLQTVQALSLIAADQLVTRLAADRVLSAQCRKAHFILLPSHNKPQLR